MKNITVNACLLLTSLIFAASSSAQDDLEALRSEAQAIVMQFATTLKPRLQEAIAEGGLEHAVTVCAAEAPEIAAKLAQSSGWAVRRVSLKTRNSTLATPDTFEQTVLEEFATRQAAGESPDTLAYAQIDGTRFRFMKAQPTEGLCLSCHGTAISPDLLSILDRLYPGDSARGYALGEIRGAISVSKVLVE